MIITISNQKGGVGKTTTATSLSNCFYKKGYKTLLVDLDPQCNASDTFHAKIKNTATVLDVFNKKVSVDKAIQKTSFGDILPCDPQLTEADNLYQKTGREYMLKKSMESIKENYDYIVIDTSPHLGVLLANALTFSDKILIPLDSDRYSLQGLDSLLETIDEAKEFVNPKIEILGFLLTKYQGNTKTTKEFVNAISEIGRRFNINLLSETIPYTIKVKESISAREPLPSYAPYCTAGIAYNKLTDYIIGE